MARFWDSMCHLSMNESYDLFVKMLPLYIRDVDIC